MTPAEALFIAERRAELAGRQGHVRARQRWLRVRAWARAYRFELAVLAVFFVLDLFLALKLAGILRGN